MSQLQRAKIACLIMLFFTVRVAAQFIQRYFPQSWLPPFSAWQSGTVPYSTLLASQIVILLVGALLSFFLLQKKIHLKKTAEYLLKVVGALYLGFMLFRGCLGIYYPDDSFWGALIPTVFHIMLASWILIFSKANDA